MSVGRAPTEVPVAVSKASLNALIFMGVFYGAVSMAVILHSGAGRLLGGVL
jgi:hypothetical protein